MFDADPDAFLVVLGGYLEDSFGRGEQNIRDEGLGGDGQVVQPSAAESGNCSPPGNEVASLPRTGEIDGHLSPGGWSIHA